MKLILALTFVCLNAQAYIPATRVILQKTTENSGSTSYKIEKEVRFSSSEIPTFRETWLIQSERAMKVTVVPVGIQPAPKLTILYVSGQKYLLNESQKEVSRIPSENAERLFHFQNTDNFIQYLNNLNILTGVTGNLDLARLNRSQGVINYGIGRVTEAEEHRLSPYLWIEQDRFVVRKLRFDSETELTADQFQTHTRGLYHPNLITVTWGDQKARVNTLSVSRQKLGTSDFQSAKLEDSKDFNTTFARWNAVLEFYKRFR